MKFDTHCHVFKKYYKEDIDKVINNYKGIMIVNGYDKESNEEVLGLISKYPNVYGTLGIHPSEANIYKSSDIEFIERHINDAKIVGIGEIGLDYYWIKDNKEAQKDLFIKQIKLANKYKKPIIIHSREAVQDCYDLIKEHYEEPNAVIHSYTGSLEMAREFVKLGCKLGINGVVTFKNAKNVKEVVREMPLDNLLIETDSPYLTPEPYRGKQNKPEYTEYIALEIAKIKGKSVTEVMSVTNDNALTLFDIKPL